jgi:hypothetical protein
MDPHGSVGACLHAMVWVKIACRQACTGGGVGVGLWALGVGLWALGVWRLASGVWRLASGVWRLASGGMMTYLCDEQARHPFGTPSAHQAGTCGASLVTWRLRREVGRGGHRILNTKRPPNKNTLGGLFLFKSLTMTYSHMGKPHTTIGDMSFHF